jgi:uncharacterized damage-inducible protein DinB
MLEEVQEHFDKLEKGRLALLQKVSHLPAELVTRKPGPDRWSILEDVQHLVLAEQRTVPGAGSISDSDEKNPDMLKVVLKVLDQDVAVDVPDPAMMPGGEAGLEDLIQDWEQVRKRLHEFLANCGPEDLGKPVSIHPVTGTLNVVDLLHLIDSHFNHHRRRIEAAVESG